MQNRFGIKDFLLLVLVGAVLVSVWLSMSAGDRRLEVLQGLERRLSDVETQLFTGGGTGGGGDLAKEIAALRQAILERPVNVIIQGGGQVAAATTGIATATTPAASAPSGVRGQFLD